MSIQASPKQPPSATVQTGSSRHPSSHNLPLLRHQLIIPINSQKWSGGAYTSNTLVPRTSFKTTHGSPKSYTVIGESGGKNVHWFCGDCGSSLYTELDLMPDATIVKSGTIDDKAVREGKIGIEFYTKDRVPYSGAVEGAEQKRVFLDS
ncbi:MAG: hypothetical protein HETSPECPRED_000356 [Heterodermia speciosa]|uniref:CENP-V/GFA domain-containing protein n=1 Tax=Heterodermia speciosa TaxID=116794 RepID=A0A8H3I1K5_9LECA|nr:MAG: hypothetical protein HETSPECPRED_000356 [Heterodermia speciosa]